MKHGINIAWFECTKCGHRCTAPESINMIAGEMERYTILPADRLLDTRENEKLVELRKKHEGNEFTIRRRVRQDAEGKPQVEAKEIILTRSYAIVEHSGTMLEESDEIRLRCPQCGGILYEVSWKPRRRGVAGQ